MGPFPNPSNTTVHLDQRLRKKTIDSKLVSQLSNGKEGLGEGWGWLKNNSPGVSTLTCCPRQSAVAVKLNKELGRDGVGLVPVNGVHWAVYDIYRVEEPHAFGQ